MINFQWSLEELVEWLGAEFSKNSNQQSEKIICKSFVTDSRYLKEGDVFIALTGPRFNGHDFLAEAQQKGAVAAIISEPAVMSRFSTKTADVEQQQTLPEQSEYGRSAVGLHIPTLLVADTKLALGKLAMAYRQNFQGVTVGITGSCGKTTCRAMIASILEQQAPTLAAQDSFNNNIGVPLTLLRLNQQYRYAVIEMGANHAQEIAYLTQIAQPSVAVITKAAPVHLEGFGSLEGVARAKGEIFSGLIPGGTAILNADDRYFNYWRQVVNNHPILSFGLTKTADVYAQQIKINTQGQAYFLLCHADKQIAIHLPVLGEHNVVNALAAAAVAVALNISFAMIKQGLENMCPVDKRLIKQPGLNNSFIIDDSYNANPASLQAAIKVLAANDGCKILVFADMGELGDEAINYHREVGKYALNQGIDYLYACGNLSYHAVAVFGERGQFFIDRKQLVVKLQQDLQPGVTVLVKGSKSQRMWEIIDCLKITGE